MIQVHKGTLGHKGVLFLGRGDRRLVHPSGQGSAQIRRCRPNSAALDLHELVVDPVVNRSGATRMVTNSGDRIIHHRQTFRSLVHHLVHSSSDPVEVRLEVKGSPVHVLSARPNDAPHRG